ncbi:hypothetical protein [Rosistilla oblonga]|uniref:Uncharacterized protein n=1 Tax=Rosistilla oblonga TaxID=2527990 RepID=A0A518IV08_9BACT|nr:hypothetical protein [Rosistilla oblonga]QDV56921.1 hypothetical protein Mal33_29220 [Rosistilla oblonga]
MATQQLITPHFLDPSFVDGSATPNGETEIQQRVQRYLMRAGLAEPHARQAADQITSDVSGQPCDDDPTVRQRQAISLAIAHVQAQSDGDQRLPNRSVPTESWQAMVKASDAHRRRRHRRTRLLISLGQSLLRLPKPNPAVRTS